MPLIYLVQHGDKEHMPGDPGLTDVGRKQAARTGRWLCGTGVRTLYSSPLRRAWQTAEFIASVTGLDIRRDDRLRERANWSCKDTFRTFAAEWNRSTRNRDFVSVGDDSSRKAGERLRAFLLDLSADLGPVAAVTHSGITCDLLRTLLGDDLVPPTLLDEGMPPCAITTFDDLKALDIASVSHLA